MGLGIEFASEYHTVCKITCESEEKRLKKVVLISCSKAKRTYACEARLLYDKSSLFCKSLAYALTIAEDIFVLSAKHGLISLHEVISPYEETLNGKPQTELTAWGNKVAKQLTERFDIRNTEFVILAGKNYYEPLHQHLPIITLPLLGLSMGKRKAKLDALIRGDVQYSNQRLMCDRLHELFNGMQRYKWNTINNISFVSGVYVLFEAGEKYNDMDRIVRVGTHRSNGRLKQRLKDHFISENKDGSIFRKNIGKAILNKNNHPYLNVWNVNTSKPENIILLGNSYDPVIQKNVEESVTKYMREHFSFVCFPVTAEQERLQLEEGIIAALNMATSFTASPEWFGRYSTEQEIVSSGMWLKQGLDGVPLSEHEYKRLLTLCSDNGSAETLTPDYKIKPSRFVSPGNGMKTSNVAEYLMEKIKKAKETGENSIKIKSGTIHKELGLVSRMPTVCGAMRKLMKPNDVIHYQPPKGNGATLEIEYFL